MPSVALTSRSFVAESKTSRTVSIADLAEGGILPHVADDEW
jgi:hypothetical protein